MDEANAALLAEEGMAVEGVVGVCGMGLMHDAMTFNLAPHRVLHGDSADVLKTIPDNSVDASVQDPPAAISFMGLAFDSNRGGRAQWVAWLAGIESEVYRVLKPGAYMVVWALPRTAHWTMCALEDAGFEIKDCITHIFGSGYPKSMNVSKQFDKRAGVERDVISTHTTHDIRNGNGRAYGSGMYAGEKTGSIDVNVTAATSDLAQEWDGWGTALKPACEYWILCRKPLSEKTVIDNILRWGVGGLNIGACRVPSLVDGHRTNGKNNAIYGDLSYNAGTRWEGDNAGRWPTNLLLSHSLFCTDTCADGCPVAELDAQAGERTSGTNAFVRATTNGYQGNAYGKHSRPAGTECVTYGDTGGVSRYYPTFTWSEEDAALFGYFTKAAPSDRSRGLDALEPRTKVFNGQSDTSGGMAGVEAKFTTEARNFHPTVKNTMLCAWLARLITPKGGIVLDCFMGSGSTGVAAIREGFRFVGIEKEADYYQLARRRIAFQVSGGTTE